MLLDNYLKKCYDENAYIDFYREELAGIEVIFGNISYLGKEIIAVNEYNDNGIFDGISVFYKSDITRVRKGGNEQEAIYKLAEQKNQIIKPEFVASEKQDLIDFVSTNWRNYTFTVFTERLDSDILFIGNYLKSDQNHLLIKALTSFKSFDQYEILIRKSDITRININTIYSRDIDTLHNMYH